MRPDIVDLLSSPVPGIVFLQGRKMKITRNQIRNIIKEAIDVLNIDSGEVLEFGDSPNAIAPDAAVEDIIRRLGIRAVAAPGGYEVGDEDFERLEDEVVGKRYTRKIKRMVSTDAEAERERLDKLLNRLSDWAQGAAAEYLADNPGTDIQDIAFDLADAWQFEFDEEEEEDLLYYFDSINDLKVYAAESMG